MTRPPGEPVAIEAITAWLDACYRSARSELAESVPPHTVDGMLAALRTEGFKLADTARAVELAGHTLRGEVTASRSR